MRITTHTVCCYWEWYRTQKIVLLFVAGCASIVARRCCNWLSPIGCRVTTSFQRSSATPANLLFLILDFLSTVFKMCSHALLPLCQANCELLNDVGCATMDREGARIASYSASITPMAHVPSYSVVLLLSIIPFRHELECRVCRWARWMDR